MNNLEIDKWGNKRWYNEEGKLHREYGPAIEHHEGMKYWYINGERHREDGPAIEWEDGSKWWYINGKRHRENGPAVEWYNGYKEWWYDDEFIGHSYNGFSQVNFTQEDFDKYLRSLKIKEYW